MANAKATVILTGSALLIGVLAGVKSQVPEVEYIEVPKVETRIVTNTETVTVSTPMPMPDTCQEAVAQLESVLDPEGRMSEAAGKILLALQELNRAHQADDFKAVNNATQVLRTQKDLLDNAMIDAAQAKQDVETKALLCERDIVDR